MQETETKINKTILGDIKVASHLNQKSNLYEISRKPKNDSKSKIYLKKEQTVNLSGK